MHSQVKIAFQCFRSLRQLLEQILAGVVLLPVADKLADPDIVNNLLIIFLDEEPAPVNPDPATDHVELLAHFSGPNSNSQLVSGQQFLFHLTACPGTGAVLQIYL